MMRKKPISAKPHMEKVRDPLKFPNPSAWRVWLADHHASKLEAWLVIQKKSSIHVGIQLNEAVEEALCYGWIDGKMQSLDEHRYLLRFTPRRQNSVWAISNILRVQELTRQGRMSESGLAAVHAAKKSGQWQAAIDRENTDRIPRDLENALRRRKGGIAAYRNLPDSQKKRYVYWIQSAKREQTKKKRIDEILRTIMCE